MKLKFFGILVLFILLIGTAQASIIANIGTEGLSFLRPSLNDVIKGIVCASSAGGALICIEQYVEGRIIGYISGEIMEEINKASPQAYNAIVTYNKIKGYIDKGSSILKELQINDGGEIEIGAISFGEEQYSIKDLFTNLTAGDVVKC